MNSRTERRVPRYPEGWTDPNKQSAGETQVRRTTGAERAHRNEGQAKTTEHRAPRDHRGEIPD